MNYNASWIHVTNPFPKLRLKIGMFNLFFYWKLLNPKLIRVLSIFLNNLSYNLRILKS
jgi:hypothetical protein